MKDFLVLGSMLLLLNTGPTFAQSLYDDDHYDSRQRGWGMNFDKEHRDGKLKEKPCKARFRECDSDESAEIDDEQHWAGNSSSTSDWNSANPTQVPEPGSLACLGVGLGAMAAIRRRNKRKIKQLR